MFRADWRNFLLPCFAFYEYPQLLQEIYMTGNKYKKTLQVHFNCHLQLETRGYLNDLKAAFLPLTGLWNPLISHLWYVASILNKAPCALCCTGNLPTHFLFIWLCTSALLDFRRIHCFTHCKTFIHSVLCMLVFLAPSVQFASLLCHLTTFQYIIKPTISFTIKAYKTWCTVVH